MKHKWEASPFKTPLSRARGLGSTGGFHHWWLQRITAVSNIIVIVWGIWAVLNLVGTDLSYVQAWFHDPLNAIFLSLFIVSTFTHAALGVQVVLEDYVHCEVTKVTSLFALRIIMTGAAIAALFCVIKLSLS